MINHDKANILQKIHTFPPPQVIPELEKRNSSEQHLCNELLKARVSQNLFCRRLKKKKKKAVQVMFGQWIIYSRGFFA